MTGDEPGEFERIRRFFVPLAGPGGLGLLDDAGLVCCGSGRRLVVTADAIVILQNVSDPLSLQKKREVKKLLRPLQEAR